MIKKMLAKIIFNFFQTFIKLLAVRSKKDAILMNKIINVANFHIGRGFSGPDTLEIEVKSLLSFFNKDDQLIVIDGGAHHGNYTNLFKKNFPNATIHCFEPSNTNFEILESKFRSDSSINVYNFGISNMNSIGELFYEKDGSSMSSLYKRKLDHFDLNFDKSQQVKLVDLESFSKKNFKNLNIDLLKIDIEGNELLALEGCGELIKNIKVVQFEFGGCNIDSKTYFQDFWYYFKENNFSIHRLTPHRLLEINDYSEIEEYFKTTIFYAKNNSF
jgi:FkbM family methyltransferase